MIVADVLLAAVKDRLNATGVLEQLSGGITWGMPEERTPVGTFAVLDNVSEAKKADTSTSRLRQVMFTVNVWATPLETAGQLARVLSNALTFAPLTLSSGAVLLVEDPAVRWLEEDYYTHVVQDFRATVQQPANYSPQ